MAFSCFVADHGVAATLDQPVPTEAGLVSGVAAQSEIHAFLGVSFASPPIGELRWRPPQAPAHRDGIRKATQFAPACAQASRPMNMDPAAASVFNEDCLYLNVWTPAASTTAKLPVLVWIYGGGFQWGSTADPRFSGKNLAKKGVVLITIAYRVGPLGFLALPELTKESPQHASGNYGILDQIAALSWIKRNIAGFGGDPDNVTIFGESAGSTSVNILQASPMAKNLFQRAIGESTSQMDSAAGLPGRQSFAQAEQAGLAYETAMGAHSLAELRALPTDKLTSSDTKFWPVERDGYVLPLDVYTTFATGKQNPADVIVGANAEEGAVLRQNWIKPRNGEEHATFAKLYGAEKGPVRQSDTDTVLWQMWSWGDLNAKMPGRKSYMYWFSQSPPSTLGEHQHMGGPIHGAEIIYVFDNLATRQLPWTEDDRRVADAMSSYWTNFAKTGDPNGGNLPSWPAFAANNPRVVEFSGTPKDIALPHDDAVKFVDAYFAEGRRMADSR